MNLSSLLLSIVVSVLVGCGGSVESSGSTSSGGAAGSGGTSAGGAGGSGGSGAGGTGVTGGGGTGGTTGPMSTCTAKDDLSNTEVVGFNTDMALPSQMTVTSVSPSGLTLEGADGTSAYLTWEGPDLTGYFTEGEGVQVSNLDWQVVSSATTFAAAHYAQNFGFSGNWEATPFGGPALSPAVQCTKGSSQWSAIAADTGVDKVLVPGHETRTLGAYEIHNGGIYDWSMQGEYGFSESITVLGPVPPP